MPQITEARRLRQFGRQSLARAQGYHAARTGQPITANPYTGLLREPWRAGWRMARS